jgi:ketosteroid isomerase-like protein
MFLAIGLIGCNQSPAGLTQNHQGDIKPLDTKAQDVADLKAVEDRFIAAFRVGDVNAIMQVHVQDDSLVVFDVHPPLQYRGPRAYREDWLDFFNRFPAR